MKIEFKFFRFIVQYASPNQKHELQIWAIIATSPRYKTTKCIDKVTKLKEICKCLQIQ